MGHLTYLAVLAGCLVVTAPLELVLRVRVYARWRRLLLALVPELVVFLAWEAYAIVLAFQLLVNGVLTGRGVVTYDPAVIWGPRIAYAPVEDLLFGFALVTLTLASWAAVNRRANTASRRGRETRTRRSSTR